MNSWKDDIVHALENLGGAASYNEIYSEILRIRQNLPTSWEAVVRRTVQYHSSDSKAFQGRENIFYSVKGIGQGYWGLRSNLMYTPKAVDYEKVEEPKRTLSTVYRVLRDTSMARNLKLIYNNECQICNNTIHLANGGRYSEAHHIIPLGAPHSGPDTPDNIIVLCPNHHAMCDYGAIKLDLNEIQMKPDHKISNRSIVYHNTIIQKVEL